MDTLPPAHLWSELMPKKAEFKKIYMVLLLIYRKRKHFRRFKQWVALTGYKLSRDQSCTYKWTMGTMEDFSPVLNSGNPSFMRGLCEEENVFGG